MAGTIIVILWDPFFGAFIHRARNRGEIRDLYSALEPGMTRQQVSRQMDGVRYPHLTMRQVNAELWQAEAPFEVGAGNWILWIEFQGERVRAIRVRTEDSFHDHPGEAPVDRVLPGQSRRQD